MDHIFNLLLSGVVCFPVTSQENKLGVEPTSGLSELPSHGSTGAGWTHHPTTNKRASGERRQRSLFRSMRARVVFPLQEKSSGCWRKKEFPSLSWSLCPWMACELVVGTKKLTWDQMLPVGWGSVLSPPFYPGCLLADSRPPQSLAGAQEWLSLQCQRRAYSRSHLSFPGSP